MDIDVSIELAPLARQLGLPEDQLRRTVELLDEGNTVPFITRYRKDQTGGLDEQQIRRVHELVTRERLLAERKRTILKSIESQGKLTDELAEQIRTATSTKRLEDLYLPYRPKKQTLATIARQRGLEPLAREILGAEKIAEDLDRRALDFVNFDKGLRSQADVLLGVGHLIAEHFSERAELREALRRIVRRTGRIVCSKIPSPESEAKSETKSAPQAKRHKTSGGDEGKCAEPQREESGKAGESKSETAEGDAQAAGEPQATQASDASTSTATSDAGPAPQTAELPGSDESKVAAPAESGDAAAAEKASDGSDHASGEPPAAATDEDRAAAAAEESSESQSSSEASEPPPPKDAQAEPAAAPSPQAAPAATRTLPATDPSTATAGQQPTAEADASSDKAPAPVDEKQAAEIARREAAQRKEQARQARKARKEEEKRRKRQKKEAAYKDYFKFQESLSKLPPHRILAINRGERARVLRVKLEADIEAMRAQAEELCLKADHPHIEFLRGCLKDALNRLIVPALEREVRRELTDKAEEHAVTVFARNLRKLLLTPPVSGHRPLAVDPGFRSGCKLAALDEFGNLHGHGVIYLVGGQERQKRSRARLIDMIKVHKITVVAIGNGTACRETEHLVADVLANELKDEEVSYVVVNEAGASVYSTSPVGREELGQYDAAQRSAVSIGRRLLDPLSELVKINPANIGVGLYQHDMKAKHLQDSLDAVVESCVNYVGVDLNTASPSLLKYVSGLNQLTARRIYEHRQQHGPFASRQQLKDVPGIGEATFVQAAGFLKITGGENPLDATWIHPESYDAARQILDTLDVGIEELARHVGTSNGKKDAPFGEGLRPDHEREETDQQKDDRQNDDGQGDDKSDAAQEAGESADAAATQQADEATASSQASGASHPSGESAVATAVASSQTATPAETTSASETDEKADSSTQPDTTATAATEDTQDQGPPDQEQSENEGKAAQAAATATPERGPESGEPGETTKTDASSEDRAEAESSSTPTAGQQPAPSSSQPSTKSVLAERASQADPNGLAAQLEIGELLCRDILVALTRPGRDPREDLPPPVFRREILKLEDLKPGMQLTGTVLNVVDFGAFVDIGLHDTGLVHISRLADRYIKDPHEVVGVGDTLDVWVLDVDRQRRRVSLTAIKPGTEKKAPPRRRREQKKGKRDEQPKAKQQRRPRRQEKRDARGQRGGRREPKPYTLTSKKEVKKKLTKGMKEGREPLRTFGDLKQFYDLQENDETGKGENGVSESDKPVGESEKQPEKKEE